MRNIFDKIEINGAEYILTLSEGNPITKRGRVVAIGVNDFNRWGDAVEVKNYKAITEEEMAHIVNEHPYEFLYNILDREYNK